MTSIKAKCQEYFGTGDFYEILSINKNATEKEIKKAYHKLSLLVHPDRVPEDEKTVATEKFKVLGRIHSILQDNERRKTYDEFGDYDEENDMGCNWMDYWRNIFRKIEISDIENHKKQYIGSDEELSDIRRAYLAGKGDMKFFYEYVAYSNVEQEPRYLEIVKKMVDAGELEYYDCFFNEDKRKKKRRHNKYERERIEVESIDLEEFSRQMEVNRQKRAEQFGNMIKNIEKEYCSTKKRKQITQGARSSKRSTKSRTNKN